MTSTQPLNLAERHVDDAEDRPFFTSQQFAALSGRQQEAIRRVVQNQHGMAELPERSTRYS
jgi:hypothetical protein